MTDYLSPEDIANDISMCRSAFLGTIVIVEGDTDQIVFERFFDLGKCQILPANNKDNALRAFDSLSGDERSGVIVIVDADFDHFIGDFTSAPNVFRTDFHDMEMMMMEDRSFDSVLREYGSRNKLETVNGGRREGRLQDMLYAAVLPLGILRFMSLTSHLDLTFEELNYKKIIPKDFKPNAFTTVNYVIQFSKGKTRNEKLLTIDYKAIAEKIDSLMKNSSRDHWLQLCCGHDVAAALSLALKKLLGSTKSFSSNVDSIERSLRLSYDLACFKRSNLYSDLAKWEAATSGAFGLFPNGDGAEEP